MVTTEEYARADEGVFIGIGPTAAVDRYLSGVTHEELRDLGVDVLITG